MSELILMQAFKLKDDKSKKDNDILEIDLNSLMKVIGRPFDKIGLQKVRKANNKFNFFVMPPSDADLRKEGIILPKGAKDEIK